MVLSKTLLIIVFGAILLVIIILFITGGFYQLMSLMNIPTDWLSKAVTSFFNVSAWPSWI